MKDICWKIVILLTSDISSIAQTDDNDASYIIYNFVL